MKIKTDFTPPPWENIKRNLGFSTADFIQACKSSGASDHLMHVSIGEKKYGYSTDESEANARLIVAAPEMFRLIVDSYFNNSGILDENIIIDQCGNSILHRHPLTRRARIKKLIEKIIGKSIEELEVDP